MTSPTKAAVERTCDLLDAISSFKDGDTVHLSEIQSIAGQAATILRALQEEREWRPIKTVPSQTLVDVWCVGEQGIATYDGVTPVGDIRRNRHKHPIYGWFGNQSNDGLPNGTAPDLRPIAWRPVAPECPIEMIAAATGWPLPQPPAEEQEG